MLSGAVHKMTIPFCNNCLSSNIVFIRLWNKNKKAFQFFMEWNWTEMADFRQKKKQLRLFFCEAFLLLVSSLVTQRAGLWEKAGRLGHWQSVTFQRPWYYSMGLLNEVSTCWKYFHQHYYSVLDTTKTRHDCSMQALLRMRLEPSSDGQKRRQRFGNRRALEAAEGNTARVGCYC